MRFEIKNLTVSYNGRPVVKSFSLTANAGEIIGLCGGNGTGKTTICRCAAGLVPYGSTIDGEIAIDGKNIFELSSGERVSKIGIIFQNPDTQLFSPTVEDEISFGPENLCIQHDEIELRVQYALKICQIEHLRKAKTNKLSGGEKQLTAIAAILAMQPKILIADEITAHVDSSGRKKIAALISAFAAAGGTVIVVSHREEELSLCDRIIRLAKPSEEADEDTIADNHKQEK